MGHLGSPHLELQTQYTPTACRRHCTLLESNETEKNELVIKKKKMSLDVVGPQV